ncbi:unnamed protein product [Rotaria magnacalcarata]|uniref:G-protein coupled receptors family 1 profile domain-containing protein n=1 Tax=Rotaria magnacalcarata TaxID=392030 RepID=A0A816SYI2_9BILA|nr:unnamed protein product [Rotaria magnacalcarata]
MNNTLSSISSALIVAPYQLNIWFGIFLWVTGNLGSIGEYARFYAYFDNYIEIVFTAICPPVAVIVLTYLLIRSVRNVIQRQIISGNNAQVATVAYRSNLEQMDSRLTSMLILQSMIVIITYIPFAAELVYTNVTQN